MTGYVDKESKFYISNDGDADKLCLKLQIPVLKACKEFVGQQNVSLNRATPAPTPTQCQQNTRVPFGGSALASAYSEAEAAQSSGLGPTGTVQKNSRGQAKSKAVAKAVAKAKHLLK